MIEEVKEMKPDRDVLIDIVINALSQLQAFYPEQEIYVEVPGNVARCRLGDAVIFEGMIENGSVIAIDTE